MVKSIKKKKNRGLERNNVEERVLHFLSFPSTKALVRLTIIHGHTLCWHLDPLEDIEGILAHLYGDCTHHMIEDVSHYIEDVEPFYEHISLRTAC